MPSYVVFDPRSRELVLRCRLCGETVVLTTAAGVVGDQIKPDPRVVVTTHYLGDRLTQGRCRRWNGESQYFYVKDVTKNRPTEKFQWPLNEDEEVSEYSIHCTMCGEVEDYSGPTDVGAAVVCEICDHPLVRHQILTSGAATDYGDDFVLPTFT